jgi:hypothetical protein
MEQNPIDSINLLELVRLLDPAYSSIRSKTSAQYSNSSNGSNYINSTTNTPNLNANVTTNNGNSNGNYSNQQNMGLSSLNLNLISTGNSAILMAAGINYNNALHLTNQINKQDSRGMMQPLDFCYTDDLNSKFCIVDAVNLCVTVVAYATHASRAYQMLQIVEILVPKYLEHLKHQTEVTASLKSVKLEYNLINKISIALKTMVHCADLLTRTFGGPKLEGLNASYKNSKVASIRSPSILPDEDSMR